MKKYIVEWLDDNGTVIHLRHITATCYTEALSFARFMSTSEALTTGYGFTANDVVVRRA